MSVGVVNALHAAMERPCHASGGRANASYRRPSQGGIVATRLRRRAEAGVNNGICHGENFNRPLSCAPTW